MHALCAAQIKVVTHLVCMNLDSNVGRLAGVHVLVGFRGFAIVLWV